MHKILFLKKLRKDSGGHIKLRDYFRHCVQHPALEPFIYFTPDSDYQASDVWSDLPQERLVRHLQFESYALLFLDGTDWKLLPTALRKTKKIINLVQHVRHGDPTGPLFRYLAKPAWRICVSQEVYDAVAPYVVGDMVTIPCGVPWTDTPVLAKKRQNSIFIWAGKNPRLGLRLYDQLTSRGVEVSLQTELLPQEQFMRRMAQADILVVLPNRTEGFFLPALEGMLQRCAVICSDAIGNRSFCRSGETCLMPEYDDYHSHISMLDRLLSDGQLKDSIRQRGAEIAHGFTLEAERRKFYEFLANAGLV
jgi:hypothetical protein